MSIFGWSYPPGAANDPNAPYNQEDLPCDICGQDVDDCICPECPSCGQIGELQCYDGFPAGKPNSHGLTRSLGQVVMKADAEKRWAEEARDWDDYADEISDDLGPSPEPENYVVDDGDRPHREWKCEHCGAMNSELDGECQFCEGDKS